MSRTAVCTRLVHRPPGRREGCAHRWVFGYLGIWVFGYLGIWVLKDFFLNSLRL